MMVVITPPAPLVSLEDAKAHLRVDHADEDTLITAYIAAASGHIDGPAGWLGRSIGTQTLEYRSDDLCGVIRLPNGPVVSIASLKFVDGAGVEQTLGAEIYQLEDDRVGPAHGQAWPAVRGDRGGVRIRYIAGSDTVPAPIVAAVLLMVGDLYAFRETATLAQGAAAIRMSTTVENLLSPFRIWQP